MRRPGLLTGRQSAVVVGGVYYIHGLVDRETIEPLPGVCLKKSSSVVVVRGDRASLRWLFRRIFLADVSGPMASDTSGSEVGLIGTSSSQVDSRGFESH
jgi:hypothetical protein